MRSKLTGSRMPGRTRNGRAARARRRLAGAGAVLAVLAVAACSGAGGTGTGGAAASPSAAAAPAGAASSLEQQYEQVVARVLPSVVQISTSSGSGSGVIYDTKGDIITNAHVVGSATALQVSPANGGKPLPRRSPACSPPTTWR